MKLFLLFLSIWADNKIIWSDPRSRFYDTMYKRYFKSKSIERGAGDDYPVITPQNWK